MLYNRRKAADHLVRLGQGEGAERGRSVISSRVPISMFKSLPVGRCAPASAAALPSVPARRGQQGRQLRSKCDNIQTTTARKSAAVKALAQRRREGQIPYTKPPVCAASLMSMGTSAEALFPQGHAGPVEYISAVRLVDAQSKLNPGPGFKELDSGNIFKDVAEKRNAAIVVLPVMALVSAPSALA